jgi:hypothetical protein
MRDTRGTWTRHAEERRITFGTEREIDELDPGSA